MGKYLGNLISRVIRIADLTLNTVPCFVIVEGQRLAALGVCFRWTNYIEKYEYVMQMGVNFNVHPVKMLISYASK